MKNRTILVTGGAGFIGSHFVRYILKKHKNCRVINLDALTYAGNKDNFKDVRIEFSNRYTFINGNILDSKLLSKIFRKYKFDYVVHFAAESHVDNSIISAQEFIRTNYEGTFNLLNFSRDYKVEKFLHISTDEVYGDVHHGRSLESARFAPSSPYSASKAAADLLVQAFVRTYNFPAVMVRGANNFGTHQYPEKLIPSAITRLIENKKVLIHGDGLQKRSWLHVSDFCSAIDLVLHKAKVGSVYNVGGELYTNLQIVNLICKKLGLNPKNGIKFVADRPGGDRRYCPDDSLIKRELGWEPKFGIQDTMCDIINWYKAEVGWWKKLKKSISFEKNEKNWQGISLIK